MTKSETANDLNTTTDAMISISRAIVPHYSTETISDSNFVLPETIPHI
jgi:hypothetical protein